MQEIFRANTGLMVITGLVVGAIFVLSAVAAIMKASGASLKPIVFMAVLFSLVLIPQLIGHLVISVRPAPNPPKPAEASGPGATGASAAVGGLETSGAQFTQRDAVFGPGILAAALQDARKVFGPAMPKMEVGELAMTESGETILVAQFPGELDMWRAAASYVRTYQLGEQEGVLETGLRGKAKLSGAFVEMLGVGRVLFVWTGITREAVEKRRALSVAAKADGAHVAEVTARRERAMAGGAVDLMPSQTSIEAPREPLFPSLQFLAELFRPVWVKAGGIAILLGAYVLVFFKGAAWAATVEAVPGVAASSAGDLERRLAAINELDVPFRLDRGEAPGEWNATWRYADARWLSVSSVNSMRKAFRIRLVLDPDSKVVRTTDYVSTFDGSAGRGGLKLEWRAASGLIFFQKERGRVLGVQIDESGRFKPDLSYSYRFNMDELKTPLIEAVVRSGWKWRPTLLQGPVWLRWLTE